MDPVMRFGIGEKFVRVMEEGAAEKVLLITGIVEDEERLF